MYQVRNFQAPHLSGLENDSLGAPVPILILRYDPKDRPPPGWSEAARLDNWPWDVFPHFVGPIYLCQSWPLAEPFLVHEIVSGISDSCRALSILSCFFPRTFFSVVLGGCRRSWLLTMTRVGQVLSHIFRLYSWVWAFEKWLLVRHGTLEDPHEKSPRKRTAGTPKSWRCVSDDFPLKKGGDFRVAAVIFSGEYLMTWWKLGGI